MTARLKTLERYLACLRAQAALLPVAENFADRWQQALDQEEPLPEVFDLIEAAIRVSAPVLAFAPIDAYLKQCARNRRTPDPTRVITAIVHGYAEANLMGLQGETCACPMREPLLKPRRTFGGPAGDERDGPWLMSRIARSLEGMEPESVSHLMRK